MFYCFLHGWYSDEEPCPACHPVIISTVTSNTEGTASVSEEDWKAALVYELRYDNYDDLNTDERWLAEWMFKRLTQ